MTTVATALGFTPGQLPKFWRGIAERTVDYLGDAAVVRERTAIYRKVATDLEEALGAAPTARGSAWQASSGNVNGAITAGQSAESATAPLPSGGGPLRATVPSRDQRDVDTSERSEMGR